MLVAASLLSLLSAASGPTTPADSITPAAPELSSHDGPTAEQEPARSLLTRLRIPEELLPTGCVMPDLRPDDFPVPGLIQGGITTDARALAALDESLTRVGADRMTSAYYAVYQANGELGVVGWSFTNAEVALRARDNLIRTDRCFRAWLEGEYVIMLWRDSGPTDACLQQMAAQIDMIVAAQHTPSLTPLSSDAFDKDTRRDYRVSGRVNWQPGRLTLRTGASIGKTANGSEWTRVTLELAAEERQTPDFDVELSFGDWSNLVEVRSLPGESSEVLVRVAAGGKAADHRAIGVARERRISRRDISQLVVEYRWGVMRVSVGEAVLVCVLSHDRHGVSEVRIVARRGTTEIRRLQLDAWPVRALSNAAREQLEQARSFITEMGESYQRGRMAEALSAVEKAMAIHLRVVGRDSPLYATDLHNSGMMQHILGDYAGAEQRYREALSIRRRLLGQDHHIYASSLHNLAALYASMGDDARAEPLYTEAVATLKKVRGNRHPEYGTSLDALGQLYRRTGRHREAEPLYRAAARLRRETLGEDHPDYAMSLNSLAELYRGMGEYDRAEPLFTQGLGILQQVVGEQHPNYELLLNNLALLYHLRRDYDRAETRYERALELTAAKVGEGHPDYARGLNNLAGLYQSRGDLARAEPLLRRAAQIVRKHLDRSSIVQSERQQHRHQTLERFHFDRWLSSAPLWLSDAPQPPLPHSAILEAVWRWKGAVTIRQRAYRQLAATPSVAPVFASLQAVSRQLSGLSATVPQAPPQSATTQRRQAYRVQRDDWEDKFAALNRRHEDLAREIALKSRAFRAAQDPLTADELRKLLPPGTAFVDFLEYNYGTTDPEGRPRQERRYLVFVMSANREPTLLTFPRADEIEAAITTFRAAFDSDPDKSVPQETVLRAAAELRTRIWVPIENLLGGARTVVISPDTAIGTLPFAALPGWREGTYLLEEYRFASMPLAALLPQLLDAAPRSRVEKGLLVVGDVDYNARLSAPEVHPKDEAPPPWMRRSAPSGTDTEWQSLAGFADELAVVRDRFESRYGTGITVLRGDRATEAALIREAPRHYNLHVITHGYFADPALRSLATPSSGATSPVTRNRLAEDALIRCFQPGLLSGLVLAGANHRPPGDTPDADGVLTATEIESLDLSGVDLVVLSACETGLGLSAGGEGLLGLQRAFQVAGARSCLATLWEVEDKATQELMSRFYRYYWIDGLPKIDALRNAQLDILRDPSLTRGAPVQRARPAIPDSEDPRSDPRFWGGFTLSGDWR